MLHTRQLKTLRNIVVLAVVFTLMSPWMITAIGDSFGFVFKNVIPFCPKGLTVPFPTLEQNFSVLMLATFWGLLISQPINLWLINKWRTSIKQAFRDNVLELARSFDTRKSDRENGLKVNVDGILYVLNRYNPGLYLGFYAFLQKFQKYYAEVVSNDMPTSRKPPRQRIHAKEIELREIWDRIEDFSKDLYLCVIYLSRASREVRRENSFDFLAISSDLERIHSKARGMVWKKAQHNLLPVIPIFTFWLIFTLTHFLWGALILRNSTWFITDSWWISTDWLVGSIVISIVVYVLLASVVRYVTEQTESTYDDIAVGLASAPLTAFIGLVGVYKFSLTIPVKDRFALCNITTSISQNGFLKATMIFVLGWLTIFIFNRLIVYALSQWAERTDQRYDDMFVRIIQLFGTFIILAFYIGLELAAFSGSITRLTNGENVLLPYSIIVSTFGALLGFASNEGIENFFGGVLLQVDKPFEPGNRILIDGRLCDVQEIGMRSTKLYDITQSIEISIPNKKLAGEIIVNLSRPDLSLRLSAAVLVPSQDAGVELWADGCLLDVAYSNEEIDQMRISEDEIPEELKRVGRMSMRSLLARLENVNGEKYRKLRFHAIEGENIASLNVPEIYQATLNEIERLRKEYSNYAQKMNSDSENAALRKGLLIKASSPDTKENDIWEQIQMRYGFSSKKKLSIELKKYIAVLKKRASIMGQISRYVERLEQMTMVIIEELGYQPTVKELSEELQKEPRVVSRATSHLEELHLELQYFTIYMGRRDGVGYQTDKEIRRSFSLLGIPFVHID